MGAPGRVRHSFEELAWATRSGARQLLERDLTVIDRHRRAGSPSAFQAVEESHYSQNGEDGILTHLFEQLDIDHGYFVEIGAADGEENSTRALVERGWSGVWLEGDPDLAKHARQLYDRGSVTMVNSFIDSDNAVRLLTEAGVPDRLDLLSVDVDGNDWWILEQLLGRFAPTVVVAEYNGSHRYPWVLPYDRSHRWDRSWRHGASLEALVELAGRFGLDLVGCDSTGVNAFFVAHTVRPGSIPSGSVAELYVPPTHRPGTLGHPRRSAEGRGPTPDLDSSRLAAITCGRTSIVGSTTVPIGSRIQLITEITNNTTVELTSAGEHPVRLSYRILDREGTELIGAEPLRAPLASAIKPGRRRPSGVEVQLPSVEGRLTVIPTLVHEGVAWRPANPTEGVEVTTT